MREKTLSPAQQKRRAKILSVARDMLTQKGYDGVTMRELALRSDVALKTLYDVYGSKDDLIIEAVKDRVANVFAAAEAAAGDLRGVSLVLHFVESGARATLATVTLSRAVVPLIFGPTDRFEFAALYERYHSRGLRQIEAAGELRPWVEIAALRDHLFHALSGVLDLWAKEQIKTKQLTVQSRLTTAEVLAPVVTGRAEREVLDAIKGAYDEIYGRGRAKATTPSRRRRREPIAA